MRSVRSDQPDLPIFYADGNSGNTDPNPVDFLFGEGIMVAFRAIGHRITKLRVLHKGCVKVCVAPLSLCLKIVVWPVPCFRLIQPYEDALYW
jgi:hypothetical protein